MPIRPKGAILYFPTLGASLIADSVALSFDTEFFDRNEFSNERLRQAKNSDGSKPIFIELFGGKLVQLLTTCNANGTVRSLLPDDANVDNIKRRWDIRRYRITGLESYDDEVNILYNTAVSHQLLIDKMQSHIAEVSMDVSYNFLIGLQSANSDFSNLTTTGFSMYGDPISPIGKLTSPASIGNTSISSDVWDSLVVGQHLIINPGTGTAEVVSVTSTTTGVVHTSALVYNHSANEPVQLYETNMLISDFNPNVEKVIPQSNGGFIVRKVWEMTIEHRDNVPAESTSV